MTTIRLRPEPMTPESFAPFGEVWRAAARPADHRTLVPTGFAHDGRATVSVIWQPSAGLGFDRLERHFGVTQGFVHLEGAPAAVCVAPPSASDNPADVPPPSAVRAFRLEPGLAFAYRRGTWHSLDRYLLAPPGATFLIVNSDPNPTQIVSYATGEVEVHRDLGSDAAPRRRRLPGEFGIGFEITP